MSYIVNDVEYNSMEDACKQLGVSRTDVLRLSFEGYSIDEAFSMAVYELGDREPFEFMGRLYDSLETACFHLKVDYKKVKQVMEESNLDGHSALHEVMHAPGTFWVCGVDYGTLRNACDHFGVGYHTIKRYLREDQTMSIDKAFRKAVMMHVFVVKGFDYGSKTNACRKLGVSQRRLNELLAEGYSVDDAFEELLSNKK